MVILSFIFSNRVVSRLFFVAIILCAGLLIFFPGIFSGFTQIFLQGELAPAVTATINMSGHHVDFVVTHMGNDRDNLDRKLQAQKLAEELDNA